MPTGVTVYPLYSAEEAAKIGVWNYSYDYDYD